MTEEQLRNFRMPGPPLRLPTTTKIRTLCGCERDIGAVPPNQKFIKVAMLKPQTLLPRVWNDELPIRIETLARTFERQRWYDGHGNHGILYVETDEAFEVFKLRDQVKELKYELELEQRRRNELKWEMNRQIKLKYRYYCRMTWWRQAARPWFRQAVLELKRQWRHRWP